jgi:hypothetical protein
MPAGITRHWADAGHGGASDGAVRSFAPLSFRDNGDGTITDLNTGLMWEKRDDTLLGRLPRTHRPRQQSSSTGAAQRRRRATVWWA